MKRITLSAGVLLVALLGCQTASAQTICPNCRPSPVIVAPMAPPIVYMPRVTYTPYQQTGVVIRQRRFFGGRLFFGRWGVAPVYSPMKGQ